MAKIGSVLVGKYEILKEIGRGGMSYVYLAMDTHLNRNWAVKEVRKRGSGKNHDEIVVNSLLAEANMVKRLDHPALPRIVDIIDDGTTIYIVMDFIEGESLDKIVKEYGAQPEEKVIAWAMQVCDVFSYLHSQKPPIIYRDMKPSNLMLKPNGNISIIDFGIAREYKEQNLADTTVLGTKGYAPPEQYSGQTDPRSDIFALGMTMHHLLTGVDPRNGEPYAPVRQWNPELSEGIEAIINKCVEPAAENRYQSCAELLLDLQDPSKVTRGWRRKLKRRFICFAASAGFCIVSAIAGLALRLAATGVNNRDYDVKLITSNPAELYEAIEIYPERPDAYNRLIDYYKNHGADNNEIKALGNAIDNHSDKLNVSDPETAKVYYNTGKLFFSDFDAQLKARSANAKKYFEAAASENSGFEKKRVADCYRSICNFMTTQSNTSEHSLDDYNALFEEIDNAAEVVGELSDNESNYDKISLYYAVILLTNDQAKYMAGVGFDKQRAFNIMDEAYNKSITITSTLPYVIGLQDKLKLDYPKMRSNVELSYNEVEKHQNWGNN